MYILADMLIVALAAGKTKPATVPWTALAKNPGHFLPPELIPPGVIFTDYQHMWVQYREACVRLWLELGYIYVINTKAGKNLAPAVAAKVAPAGPAEPALIVAAGVVNRYGSCGREVLAAAGLQLYEDAEEVLDDLVMEDRVIDPPELERAEDAEHSHFAPCTVPVTSEARAQYCLTALQLVVDGRDKHIAIKCVRSLVGLPVSYAFRRQRRQRSRQRRQGAELCLNRLLSAMPLPTSRYATMNPTATLPALLGGRQRAPYFLTRMLSPSGSGWGGGHTSTTAY